MTKITRDLNSTNNLGPVSMKLLLPVLIAFVSLPSFAAGQNESEFKNITFDDIKMDIEAGDEYDESYLTDDIKSLNKVKIKLRGYMFPTPRQSDITKFILVRDNQECCYGPNAAIHDCVLISLDKGESVDFTVRPVTVEGTFYLKEFRPRKSGRPLAVYRIRKCEITR